MALRSLPNLPKGKVGKPDPARSWVAMRRNGWEHSFLTPVSHPT